MATITFTVNLETVNKFSAKQPYSNADRDNLSVTRSTWFPDILRNNRKLKNGDQFTLTNEKALYLKNNFTSGEFKFLDIASETA